jgi:hypothetical protein
MLETPVTERSQEQQGW